VECLFAVLDELDAIKKRSFFEQENVIPFRHEKTTHRPASKRPREKTGRVLGYARVSTHEQRLDLQLNALRAAGCDQIFTDHGHTGKNAKRPGLEELLDEVQAGDMIVIWKLDRLGRSLIDLANFSAFFSQNGIDFKSLTEGFDIKSAYGMMVYRIMAVCAEFESDMISQRTKEGLRAARARGVRLGRPPKSS